MKITTVLSAEVIEPSLAFWVDRIGFEKSVELPEENRLGFVILRKDEAELMIQSYSLAEKDSEAGGRFARQSKAALFIEIADFEDVLRRLEGYPVEMPVRDTFYGMREIGVLDPGGNFVVFAMPLPNSI